ncbi:DUF448 domain-containing protein [Croceicoccus sp. BE223]|uniref:DUF448 domain-containing protein n=1 Tax=Croceicoccus sp. BE223 TaxID=2817716 RepID=UPI0028570D27|nr:DUF448 domain-containing protein [Croceicoccus sp. BE223]MDR7103759.1 putative RNA-binding protein YlxR (DUF448 family) [Croceicoccus sp. BE223]
MRNPRNDTPVSPVTADPATLEGADSFDDGSARAAKRAPERRCVLSGRTAPREQLLRLAVGPEGQVLPDAHAKAPGRGAWLGSTRAELEAAVAKGHLKGALARGFRTNSLRVPDNLADLAQAALTRALTDRLGIEWRSGNLIAGSDRIAEQARSGKVAWLGHAADASEDGSRRLDQAWRVGEDAEGTGMAGLRLPLDRAALSVALGRDNVVHLAVTDRAAAARISAQLARLMHFLGPDRPAEPTAGQGHGTDPPLTGTAA